MTSADLLNQRLINQQIAASPFSEPAELVTWLGAMQAQEFALAKWAIGLRLSNLVDADVEKAFTAGKILRTHVLRPTWHFVAPADIRWMLKLTGPRVRAVSASMFRKLELDQSVFRRTNNIFVKALEGGRQCTRPVLKKALERAKITADGLRLGYLLMGAELDGLICSGAKQGKQFTYALLDERAPAGKVYDNDDALGELAQRYFTSRGPATIRDFVWWSGLTMAQAKAGVSMLSADFIHEVFDEQEYIFPSTRPAALSQLLKANPAARLQKTFLLPDYDEYGISYKNRDVLFSPMTTAESPHLGGRSVNVIFNHMIVVDGKIGGSWKRVIKNNKMTVETSLFPSISKTKLPAVMKAVKRFLRFVGE